VRNGLASNARLPTLMAVVVLHVIAFIMWPRAQWGPRQASSSTTPVIAYLPPLVEPARSVPSQPAPTSAPGPQQAAEQPKLDLRLPARRGSTPAAEATLANEAKSVQERLADEVAKSARADCRTAYSGAGLLAIPMLIWDSVKQEGCKW
jgi:hypothetical protein